MNSRLSSKPIAGTSRRKILLIVAAVTGVVGIGGLLAATAFVGSYVRGKLELIAKEAGLKLKLDDVSVGAFGHVHVKGLAFSRPDGTAVVSVQEADAHLSLWRALRGKRRPSRAAVKGFAVDVLLVDGKPKELLDLYKAARTVFPRRAVEDDPKEAKEAAASALAVESGVVTVRMQGKGSAYLPQGLRVRDIGLHIDLANGVGDLKAVVDGTVASTLSATLEARPDATPRLRARFAPEFRLKFPASAPLPLGVDSVSVAGVDFDLETGGAVDSVVLRRGDEVVVSVQHVRPARTGLGIAAEQIVFAVPQGASSAVPVPAKGAKAAVVKAKPATALTGPARTWAGSAASLSLAVESTEAGELPMVLRLVDLKVTIPGPNGSPTPPVASKPGAAPAMAAVPAAGLGVIGLAALELRTDRIPGEQPLQALTSLKVEQPSVDLPWREDAMAEVPGGRQLWAAVKASEEAKIRRAAEEEAEDEIEDPNLPPEARRKQVQDKVAQKLKEAGVEIPGKPAKGDKKAPKSAIVEKKEPGAASKSAVLVYVKPLRDLHERLLSVDGLAHKAIDRMAQAPRLKVEVVGGRVGLVKPGLDKPFGGVQDIQVSWTPVLGDGTRGLLATAKPFDDERVWGEVSAEVVTGPGAQLNRARFKLAGGQFAQALRIVSSSVTVSKDSDVQASFELKLAASVAAPVPGAAPVAAGQAGTGGASRGLTVTGEYKVFKVGFDWWRLAPTPIHDLSASGKLALAVTPTALRLDLTDLMVAEAKLHLLVEATEIPSKPVVHVRAEMPKQDCGAVARSIPPGMLTNIGTIEAKGEASWLLDLAVPLQSVYKSTLELELDDATCEVSKFSNMDLEELATEFVRPVNENGTMLDEVLVGPLSGSWVSLPELHPWTPWAMIATEDGAFYKHRGIRPGLLLRAIRLDLDYGRFVYGGSTITQQLVKNIYLTRAKHLSRKFEELLIVWQLERRLPKDRILELYLNFIEYGPNIYGIERAAQTYFGKPAAQLTPLESAFLAANKPCPRCGYTKFATKKWDPWWQERMIGIMNKMRDEGIIDEEKFLAEAPYIPRFVGWPAPTAPTAEAPLGGIEE